MSVNTLLMGPTGTGKTYSCITLLPYFERVVVLSHEKGFFNVFDKACKEQNISTDLRSRLRFRYIAPSIPSWATMISNAEMIQQFSNDALQKMPGMNKMEYGQFIQLLLSMSEYKCDVTGENLGPTDEFPENWCIFHDGLSGISKMALDLAVGGKPIRTQPDWGVGMENVENFIIKVTGGLRCSYVLVAHVDREYNMVKQIKELVVLTLGQKLAPKLPDKFDEVILTSREGDTFSWSTAAVGADLKARILPLRDGLAPDFGQIFAR